MIIVKIVCELCTHREGITGYRHGTKPTSGPSYTTQISFNPFKIHVNTKSNNSNKNALLIYYKLV
jgi:hypothetical protein